MSEWLADLNKTEIVKLLLQMGGALIVARLTVFWALRRYKSEKAWERQHDTLTTAVQAISELQRVVDEWANEDEERNYPEEYSDTLRARFATAKRDLERVTAAGRLILPDNINSVLETLIRDLNAPAEWDWWPDRVSELKSYVEKASGIIPAGRRLLGSAPGGGST